MSKIGEFFSRFYEVQDVYDESYDNDYEGTPYVENNFVDETPYTAPYEESFVAEEPSTVYQAPVATTTPIPAATVIMLTPYDIRTSQVVCEHIRQGHIVICNLTPNSNNQRVVDYISGAVFALDGKIEPTPVKTTFVCTPKHVDLIVDAATEESGTKVSAL